jgi:outer membrane protein OmpA-like peptidoglycan-associated protein
MLPSYQSGIFALALTVHYDTSKATLKAADIKALNLLVNFVKIQGYRQIYVVGHTDPRQHIVNFALSKARAMAVIAYLQPRLRGVTYAGTALADKVPFSTGKGNLSLALNRRAEIFVR